MMGIQWRDSSSEGNSEVMFDSEEALVDPCCTDQHYSTDRISMLPDELLVSILSLLTLKESVATSLLSRRWRYSWTLMPTLDFDAESSLLEVEMTENNKMLTDEERAAKYVRWVDHVIALHKCYAIEDFRVYYGLTKSYEKYIDNWVNYALERKVKRLELNLTCRCDVLFNRSSVDCYTFPYKFMRQYMENCSNESQSQGMRQFNPIHFNYLEKISMTQVNVNGEALEFFLSNCPLLQHLSVSKSKELLTLKIIGPFPSLKHLEIISCHNLNSFEICDANLVYLKYVGSSIQKFFLKNVPLLVEVYISGLIEMRDVLSMFSSILPQLEKFNFQLGFWLCWEVSEMMYSAVKMSSLKQLVLKPLYEHSLLPITNILRASPCLETFVLEIPRFPTRCRKKELEKVEGSYAHLKEVKIRGYCGSMDELEFVMHLSESAPALEKIIIDPLKPYDTLDYFMKSNPGMNYMYTCRVNSARIRATKQLLGILPPRISVEIL